jgi:hypothetical protein
VTATTFIVAEIAKTWINGHGVNGDDEPLCMRFEKVIEHNLQRGYRLDQFQLNRLMVGFDQMNETIIAVFVSIEREKWTMG